MVVGEVFVPAVRSIYGDRIRAVAEYDEDTCEMLYIDRATAEAYGPDDREDIHAELVLADFIQPHYEQLYHDLGGVRAESRLFEAGAVAYLNLRLIGGRRNVIVLFRRGADPALETLWGLASVALETATEPAIDADSVAFVEDSLRTALHQAADADARYHIREALQATAAASVDRAGDTGGGTDGNVPADRD